MDFIRPRRHRPFKESIGLIGNILNERGEVSVRDLVLKWGIVPHYAKTLLQWAAEFYKYAKFDEITQSLYIPERKPLLKETLGSDST